MKINPLFVDRVWFAISFGGVSSNSVSLGVVSLSSVPVSMTCDTRPNDLDKRIFCTKSQNFLSDQVIEDHL